jgi:hypothetical protein
VLAGKEEAGPPLVTHQNKTISIEEETTKIKEILE